MEPVALPRKGNKQKQKKGEEKNSGDNNEKVKKNTEKKKSRDNKDNKNKNVNKNKKKKNRDNVNEDVNRNNLKTENTDKSKTNISNTVGGNNPGENIGIRFERNDFPRFPTEVDIMLEVVGKNVDLIQRTCADGKRDFASIHT